MAATTAVSSPIDLKAPASFPLRLGNSILKPEQALRYVNLRFNHRERPRSSDATCKLSWSGKAGALSSLEASDDDGVYMYDGRDAGTKDNYVLVVRGEGKSREVVLEKLDGSHVLNINSTPKDNEKTLRARYEQLRADENEAGDDLFGEDGDDEAPLDPDNPFDYRHFLKPAEAERAKRPDPEAPRSTAGTPLVPAQRPSSSASVIKPRKRTEAPLYVPPKKRKTPASAEKPNAKRVKAGQEPTSASAPQKRGKEGGSQPPPPKIRVDRKASIRKDSYDDSGELILENETPTSDRLSSRQSAMSLALAGQLGGGPISLRSAASTPASHIASPGPARPEGMDEDELELGGNGSPGQEAMSQDDDADVDALVLPEPAQGQLGKAGSSAVAEEDDLDAQLAAAMAEADVPEEEEESEEE